MNWFTRVFRWCDRPYWDEVERVTALYQNVAYNLGVAHGQVLGRNQLMLELQAMLEERRDVQLDERDLEKARRMH